MMTRSLVVGAALAVAPLPALAAWEIDPAHTSVAFTVEHLGFSHVPAQFTEFQGDVSFDPEDLEATEVTFTIAAESIETHWDERDTHIRSEDFLDAANHPEITFVSTEVTTTGEDTAEITGDLTIRGETHPITLQAELNQVGENPFMPEQRIAGFTLTGEVDRTEYGIDFGAPVIGAVLPVTINVELVNDGSSS